jgi:hypothetical protein
MSVRTDDLRDTALADEAGAVTEDELKEAAAEAEPTVKERVALTTGAAWEFISKAPRWMKRKAIHTYDRVDLDYAANTVGEKVGKAWASFRKALQKINWVAIGLTAFALCVWVAWMFIVWVCLLYWVLLAFAVNPVLGWCVAVMCIGFGMSFSAAFTMNIVETVDNAI